MEVRPGREDDLPAIVAIYNHYVLASAATFELHPVTVEDRRGWWTEHAGPGRHRLLVAERADGRVDGWATSSPFRPRAAYATTVETSVYCRPGTTGRGIGSRLYAALLGELRTQDLERVVAGIALPNPASIGLHRRFGFRHVGTFSRVGRKFDRFWDVAWFERPAASATGLDERAAPRTPGPFADAPVGPVPADLAPPPQPR